MGRAHKIKWNPKNYRQFEGARGFGSDDVNQYQSVLERAVLAKRNNLLSFAKEYEKRIKAYRKFALLHKKDTFSNFSNRDLAEIFEQWFEHTKLTWSFAYDYIFLNRFLPDIVISTVASKVTNLGEQTRILGILFLADKQSELFQEKKSLVNIGIKIRTNRLKLSSAKIERLLEAHLRKFAYLGFYYFRGEPYSLEYLRNRLKEFLKLSPRRFVQLQTDITMQDRNIKLTPQTEKKLGLDDSTVLRIKLIKRWASLATEADETYGYVVHALHGLWMEICERLQLTYPQFYSLTGKEILAGLMNDQKSKFLKTLGQFRHDSGAVIILEKGRKVIPGKKELQTYIKRESREKEKIQNVNELKGQPASAGKARGRVRLVFSVHDVSRVQKGDILVAPATNPTFVPAMERAKAIITDEGGLLSHAAIVSRELRVPCIVGTRIGTRILKDGDLVEVDAEKGIVRRV